MGKRGPGAPELSEDEWWALAQHHGLATPMIDWTYSPFIALFFAFEEEKCLNATGDWVVPAKRIVLCTGLDILNQIQDDADRPNVFAAMNDANHRLVNQAGLLMKMPQGRDLEAIVRKNFAHESGNNSDNPMPRTILQKIEVPGTERVACLKYLNKMNINRMSLFPDLDGAAACVNALWELDYDRMMGFVMLRNSSTRES